jgi:hypothetical protein
MNDESLFSRFIRSSRTVVGSQVAVLLLVALVRAAQPPLGAEHRTDGGIPYATGGIGSDELDDLTAHSAAYDLKLVFAIKDSRAFLADVSVRISEETGREILAVDHAGPLFFTQLPTGTYRVEGMLGGMSVAQTVKVAEHGRTRIAFYWPQGVERGSTPRDVDTNAKGQTAAPRHEARPAGESDISVTRDADSSDPAGRIDVKINRLWSVGRMTYAALTIRNDANFSLVKIGVQCKGSGRSGESLEEQQQTILSPAENPMQPGTVRNATFTFARGEGEIRSVSCEARAL